MDPYIAGLITAIVFALWVVIKVFLKISAWIFWIVVAGLVAAILFIINLFPK
jgi:hypothetical protein